MTAIADTRAQVRRRLEETRAAVSTDAWIDERSPLPEPGTTPGRQAGELDREQLQRRVGLLRSGCEIDRPNRRATLSQDRSDAAPRPEVGPHGDSGPSIGAGPSPQSR